MREGDLAFRCGRGVFSRAVMSAEEEPLYSHVGVLVKEEGTWKVVHAVPGESEFSGDFDRVKAEALDGFFRRTALSGEAWSTPGWPIRPA